MDQASFQAVTKLEQRLEQSRKQRQKLKHELGELDHRKNFVTKDHEIKIFRSWKAMFKLQG